MRILVFGAGVLGCHLARNLFRGGADVTLLARGGWAEEIQKNGLRIKDMFSPRVSVSHLPVVTALRPDERYDVILVAVRYTQIDSILDALRANETKTIVFFGNNVRAGTLRKAGAAAPKSKKRGTGHRFLAFFRCRTPRPALRLALFRSS